MSQDSRRNIYAAESGNLDVALLGDAMLNRRLSCGEEQDFLAVRELLRGADATFANLETVVRRPEEGSPTVSYATYTSMAPELLAELRWLGIDLLSCANNHAYDYGEGGVLATVRHLDDAGFAYSGLGRNLAHARAPGYFDSRNGRIGLVATTTTFYPWSRAGETRPDMQGRPGVNALGFETTYTVDRATLDSLRSGAAALGFTKENDRKRKHFYSAKEAPEGGSEDVLFLGARFVAGDKASSSSTPDRRDLDGNLKWIREARRQADWVIASIHSHEHAFSSTITAARQSELSEPSDSVVEFAHAAVEAGADIVAGHGSHTMMGIEIFKGRPIFYGLGNFIFQNETVTAFPTEAYDRFDLPLDATPADFLDIRTDGDRKGHPSEPAFWQSAVVNCQFEAGELKRITIRPVDLGFGRPRAQRGRPVMARGQTARDVLDRIERLSRPFGTAIERSGDIGVIRLG